MSNHPDMRLVRLLAPLFLLLIPSMAAHAEDPPAPAPQARGTSGWAVLGWGGAIGIGGRYMLPVFNEGFLDPKGGVQDRIALELGADAVSTPANLLFHAYRENELRPTAGLLWLLQLDPHWTVYPKLDLAYSIGWVSGWDDRWGSGPTGQNRFAFDIAAGAFYKVGGASVRAELGSMGLKLGAGFGF